MMNDINASVDHRPRVLVVENDEINRLSNVKLLEHWGYAAFCAEGDGLELLEDAVRKARLHHCHLALVDLHLLDDYDLNDLSGLNLIQRIKPAKTIVLTASRDSTASTESLKGGALDFVSKSAGPLRMRKSLDSSIENLSSQRSKKKIMWQNGLSSRLVSRMLAIDPHGLVPEDQADDVLIQLFKDFDTINIAQLQGSPATTTSAQIRPHSFILQVRGDEDEPVMVKLARASRIKREVENYHTYVRGKLRGQYCPVLHDHCIQWDIGGAFYTFLSANGVCTFSKMYSENTIDDLLKPLRLFFGDVWLHRYTGTLAPQEGSLFNAYCQLWSTDWYEELPTWENIRPGLPDPAGWLHQRVGLGGGVDNSCLMGMQTAVCHGDLHGDNLLVDNNGSPWVIDFERTGPGPILVDFVELEADILNRLSGFENDDQAAFESMCLSIVQPKSLLDELETHPSDSEAARKALACAQCLRHLAAQISGSGDLRPYLWGLLFSTLFRARLLYKQDGEPGQIDRTLYLASRICDSLDNLQVR